MAHPLLRTIISEMVETYLEESYEDDIVESVFEEVSEETWEAIEEAILSELSPATLNSYKKKALAQAGKHWDTYQTQYARSHNLADRADHQHRNDPGSGYELDDRSRDAMNKALAAKKRHDKRDTGIERASKRLER